MASWGKNVLSFSAKNELPRIQNKEVVRIIANQFKLKPFSILLLVFVLYLFSVSSLFFLCALCGSSFLLVRKCQAPSFFQAAHGETQVFPWFQLGGARQVHGVDLT